MFWIFMFCIHFYFSLFYVSRYFFCVGFGSSSWRTISYSWNAKYSTFMVMERDWQHILGNKTQKKNLYNSIVSTKFYYAFHSFLRVTLQFTFKTWCTRRNKWKFEDFFFLLLALLQVVASGMKKKLKFNLCAFRIFSI